MYTKGGWGWGGGGGEQSYVMHAAAEGGCVNVQMCCRSLCCVATAVQLGDSELLMGTGEQRTRHGAASVTWRC